jgi:Spy/CpxP family protein refolding chaperone
MKKLSLFALSLLLSVAAFAQQPAAKTQDPKTPEERAQFQTEKMASELQLTAAQKEQVYTINLGIAQKNEGIRTSNFSEEEKRSIIKSNREAQIEMLKNVLTAAQFEELKKELKEQRQESCLTTCRTCRRRRLCVP